MTLDDFLMGELDEAFFEPSYRLFWIRTALSSMHVLGDETDAHLERFCETILKYYTGETPSKQVITSIPEEMSQLREIRSRSDNSVLGLKYRCVNAIAEEDMYEWYYGIVPAFQLINFSDQNDQVLVTLLID